MQGILLARALLISSCISSVILIIKQFTSLYQWCAALMSVQKLCER